MTIATTSITSGPYTGNGSTSNFSYTFRVETKNDLKVFETDLAGVITELTVDTHFTVNNVGTDGGGTIDRIAGNLPTDFKWYIRSDYDQLQSTAFASQGGFFPQVHEDAFDKITFQVQQETDKVSRAIRLDDNYLGTANPTLPEPVALRGIQWDATGLALENVEINTTADVIGAILDLHFETNDLDVGDNVFVVAGQNDSATAVMALKDSNDTGTAATPTLEFRDSAELVLGNIGMKASSDELIIKSITGGVHLYATDTVKFTINDGGQVVIVGDTNEVSKLRLGDGTQASSSNTFLDFYDRTSGAYRSLGWSDSSNQFRLEDDTGTFQTITHQGNLDTEISSSGVTGDLTITAGSLTIIDTGATVLTLKDSNGAGDAANVRIDFVDSGGAVQGEISTQASSDDLQIKSTAGAIEMFANNTLRLTITDNGRTEITGDPTAASKLRVGVAGQTGSTRIDFYDLTGTTQRSIEWDDPNQQFQIENSSAVFSAITTELNIAAHIATAGNLSIEDAGVVVLTLKDTNGAGDAASIAINFTDSGDVLQAQIKTASSSDDLKIISKTGAIKIFANDVEKLTINDDGKCLIKGDDTNTIKIQVGSSTQTGDTFLDFRDDTTGTFRAFGWDDSSAEFQAEDNSGSRQRVLTSGNLQATLDATPLTTLTIADAGPTLLTLKDTNGSGTAANVRMNFTDSSDVEQGYLETRAGHDDMRLVSITGAIIMLANNTKKFEISDGGQCLLLGNDSDDVKLVLGNSGQSDNTFIEFHDATSVTDRSFGWDDGNNQFEAEDDSGVMQKVLTVGNIGATTLPAMTIADTGETVLTLKDTDGAGTAANIALIFTDSSDVEQASIKTEAGADDLQIRSQTGAIELYAANVLKLEIQDAGKCFIAGEVNEGDKLNLGDSSQGGNAYLACWDKAVGQYRSIGWNNTTNEMVVEETGGGIVKILTPTNLAAEIPVSGIDSNSDSSIAMGSTALDSITSGINNVAVGHNAATALTTGSSNVVVGYKAMDAAVAGVDDTVAIGSNALGGALISINNIAIGSNSGLAMTGGAGNTLIGKSSGVLITTGSNNICIGKDADTSAVGASNETVIGNSSTTIATIHGRIQDADAGSNNVAIGTLALDSTTNNSNVAIGSGAMENSTSPSCTTAVGRLALNANVTGNSNTAIGCQSMSSATSSNNVGVGVNTLKLATGGQNTAIGKSSGDVVGSGAGNTFLGNNAGGLVTTGDNNICIGDGVDTSSGGADNETIIGNSSTTSTEVFGVLTATGDGIVFPSFTTTNRDLITGMVAGQVIYNTTTSVLNFYNGSSWAAI